MTEPPNSPPLPARPRATSSPAGSSGDARARILDAAERLFARDGFDATPTALIAESAEVPKGLIFYYFPKKIEILLTLLAERMPVAPLCESTHVARAGDIAGSLARLAERLHLGGHDSSMLRVIVWREADTHPELQRAVQDLYHSLCHLTGQVLAHAAPEGVDPRRRKIAAAAFASAMLFAANLTRVGGPSVDLSAVAQLVADGLVARPGR